MIAEFIILMVMLLLIGFGVSGIKEKVYTHSFWWDTNNGMQYTTAYFYYNEFTGSLTMEHNNGYRHPTEHPDYEKMYNKAMEIATKKK